MLSINLEGLNEEVIPAIKNTKKYLENARYILEKITVPNGFEYEAELRSVNRNIMTIEDEAYTIDKWLEGIIIDFNEAQEKTARMLDNIFVRNIIRSRECTSSNSNKP